MAHPYRTRLKEPSGRASDERRIGTATFAFAFLCVVCGVAISGADRARSGLLGTLGGVVLLLARPRVC